MDAYSVACLVAIVVALVFRGSLAVRALAIAFLAWLGVLHHLDHQQVERMLLGADAPPGQTPAPPEPAEIVRILRRTPAGFVAFFGLAVLALVPLRRVRRDDAPAASRARDEET